MCSDCGKNMKECEHNTKTFHKFADLPPELQMKIWKHAASPPDKTKLRTFDLSYSLPTLQGTLRGSYMTRLYDRDCLEAFFTAAGHVLREYWSTSNRGTLMATCGRARLAALETWKKEVQRILRKQDRHAFGPVGHTPLGSKLEALIRGLDKLIKQLKKGDKPEASGSDALSNQA